MKIEPPADDLGLQKLKHADRAPSAVQQTDQVERSARIPTTEEHHEPVVPAMPKPRVKERRSGKERRRQQQPTLLDTRSPHERRTDTRREGDHAEGAGKEDEAPGSGIDLLA